ncbi:MAG: cyclic peptide export ABC transporter [Chloroflexi bacterium AL-W]|nr:cyclic peptide export ABC transporter [Chloroflexi bacterium AL-W]
MKLFSFLLQESRSTVIWATLASLVSGVTSAGLLFLVTGIIIEDSFVNNDYVWLLTAFCILTVVTLITGLVSDILLARLAQSTILKMRVRMSQKILSTPLRQIEELGAHKLIVTLTSDVSVLSNTIIIIPMIFVNLAIVVSCMVYLAILTPTIFGVVVLIIVFIALGYQIPVKRANKFFTDARETEDVLFKHIRALTEGIKELKLHYQRRKEFLSQHLAHTAELLKRHALSGMNTYFIANRWARLPTFILMGLLIFLIPNVTSIPNPTITASILVIIYLLTPLSVMLSLLPTVGTANVALEKLEKLQLSLVDFDPHEAIATTNVSHAAWKRLAFTNITHTYYNEQEDDHFVLGPVNLVFQPGELVFIIGGNGSGKTTLAKLIVGLYEPIEGEIRVDNQLITDHNREEYQQLFSVVFGDFYLFEQLLGFQNETLDARAHNYLVQLQIDHKVQIENGKLSTLALSQGQRKRLALLTAYLEDRPFYVFDEWAADQDPLFRDLFYTHILPELKTRGKGVIVITHDDKYLHVPDRIIKLDYGQIQYDEQVETMTRPQVVEVVSQLEQ